MAKKVASRFFYIKLISYISTVIKDKRYMIDRNKRYRTNRYPNGFMPKIEYWQYKMDKAVKELNPSAIEFAAQRLAYFVNRQNQLTEIRSTYKSA